jgi:hypothetical protein
MVLGVALNADWFMEEHIVGWGANHLKTAVSGIPMNGSMKKAWSGYK